MENVCKLLRRGKSTILMQLVPWKVKTLLKKSCLYGRKELTFPRKCKERLLSLSVTEIRFVILYGHLESAFIKPSISSAAASFDNEENNTSDSILSSSRGGHQSYQSTEIQQKQRVSSSLEY